MSLIRPPVVRIICGSNFLSNHLQISSLTFQISPEDLSQCSQQSADNVP